MGFNSLFDSRGSGAYGADGRWGWWRRMKAEVTERNGEELKKKKKTKLVGPGEGR